MVCGLMGLTSNRHWMIAALLALFVAVFVLVPVADAATCAVEAEVTQTSTLVSLPDEPTDAPSADHGLCAHGHCHHSGVALPQPAPLKFSKTHSATPALKPSNAPLTSHSPNGLKRPPRG